MLCCFIEILALLKDMDRTMFHTSLDLMVYFYSYDSVVGWLNSLKPGAANERSLRLFSYFSIHSRRIQKRGRMLVVSQNRFKPSVNNGLTNTLESAVVSTIPLQLTQPRPPCPTQRILRKDPYSISSLARRFLLAKATFQKLVQVWTLSIGKTYLSLCNGFIESLSNAIDFSAYTSCLYDAPLDEYNKPYTTEYFEILVGVISNRYLTYHWD